MNRDIFASRGAAVGRALDTRFEDRYRGCMPQSIFVFDFGSNEEAAQQARHKVDAWKQGFRLGDKMLLKFERSNSLVEAQKEGGGEPKKAQRGKSPGKKSAAEAESKKASDSGNVRLLVRLNFSDHEKLSHQRWLDRIPAEEPFKSAELETVRMGDPEFPKIVELFDSLD